MWQSSFSVDPALIWPGWFRIIPEQWSQLLPLASHFCCHQPHCHNKYFWQTCSWHSRPCFPQAKPQSFKMHFNTLYFSCYVDLGKGGHYSQSSLDLAHRGLTNKPSSLDNLERQTKKTCQLYELLTGCNTEFQAM